jgi:hypothetical protein
MLPGGRKFGQTAQKGPWTKEGVQKNLWPNFDQILPEVAEKGQENIFLRSS